MRGQWRHRSGSGDCRVMCMWPQPVHNSDLFSTFYERWSAAESYDPGKCIPHLGWLGRRLDGRGHQELIPVLPLPHTPILPYHHHYHPSLMTAAYIFTPLFSAVLFGGFSEFSGRRLSEVPSGGTSLVLDGRRSGRTLALQTTPLYHRWAVIRSNKLSVAFNYWSSLEKCFTFKWRFQMHIKT